MALPLMLTFFRRMFTSKIGAVVAAIFVGIIAIAFAMSDMAGGMNGVSFGGGSDTLAKVGGEKVTANELTEQIDRQLANARQQQPDLDMATFLAGGAYEGILSQLVSAKALVAFGKAQGLATTKKMEDAEIVSIPAFHNLAGQFDDATFRRAIQAQNLTEREVRTEIANTMIQRQLLLPVAGSPKVPEAMAQQYAALLLEQRSGEVGLVPAAAMPAGAEPSAAELAAFYKSQQARYTLPERRVLRYATFGVEQLGEAAQPTDAEIAAFYQANQAKYGAKEKRTLSQVILPSEAAARALAAKVAGGASLAQAAGGNLVPLGEQTKAELANIASAAVADAAFSAAKGASTQPIRSPLGWHIVHVDAITAIPATPLAAARAEISQQLAGQKRDEALGTMLSRIEDKLADGASFEEVAREEKLTIVETPPLTAQGIQFDNPAFKAPEIQPLLKTAFQMSPDEDPSVEPLVAGQSYAIIAVARVVAAAAPPLASVQDKVKADFAAHRAADRARQVAAAIVAKINAGTPIRQAFAETTPKLPPVEPVTARRLDIAQPNRPVPPPLAMMFSLPKGKARLLQAPNGEGWFVVHVNEIVPGKTESAPGLVQATRSQFETIMGDEYTQQFVRAVEADVGVKRDAKAIEATRQTIARSSGTLD
ncbi:peptidyl-prolyl cis-trans isomerase [Allosphingosinicella humi]